LQRITRIAKLHFLTIIDYPVPLPFYVPVFDLGKVPVGLPFHEGPSPYLLPLESAAHDVQVAAADTVLLAQPDAAEGAVGANLAFVSGHLPVVPAVGVGLFCCPDSTALMAGIAAVSDFSVEQLLFLPVERVPADSCQPVDYNADEQLDSAADNGIAGYATLAAALSLRDTSHLCTAAGRPAEERVSAQSCAANCSSHFAAAPSHDPSVDPSEAEHASASHESILAADGSNEPGHAE